MRILSAVVVDSKAVTIEIELAIIDGIPSLVITGMPGSTIKDAKDRWLSTLSSVNVKLSHKKYLINLKPSEVKKEGTQLDAAITSALALKSTHMPEIDCRVGILGELTLTGELCPSIRQYGLAVHLLEQGVDWLIVPNVFSDRLPTQFQAKILGVKHFDDVLRFLKKISRQEEIVTTMCLGQSAEIDIMATENQADFEEVYNQDLIKEALVYAIAGRHHMLLTGPPGSGKSMIAKRIPTIQPILPKEFVEKEIAKFTLLDYESDLSQLTQLVKEPFRSPHASSSLAAILGGNQSQMIGEAVLANGGVLYLDELLEFRKDVLEGLRSPLEDRIVNLSKVSYKAQLESDFTLIATANPCKCGFHSYDSRCNCNDAEIKRYRQRLSGPLLDRFTMHVSVDYHMRKEATRTTQKQRLSSEQMRLRIASIRQIQQDRYENRLMSSGNVPEGKFQSKLIWSNDAKHLYEKMREENQHSYRQLIQILRLSQTIADDRGHLEIEADDIQTAKYYNRQVKW